MGTRRTIRPNKADGSNPDVSSLRFAAENIARGAGDMLFTTLSPGGASIITWGRRSESEEYIIDSIKNELLRQMFKENRGDEFEADRLDLSLRVKLKDKIFKDFWEDPQGRLWIEAQITAKKKAFETFQRKAAYFQTLTHYNASIGSLKYLGTTSEEKSTPIRFDLSNPEIVKLVSFQDVKYLTPFLSGKPGAGKTNAALQLIDLASQRNSGYLNPSYGFGETKMRIFMPNYRWKDAPHNYSYKHPWELFIDKPKGRSIWWRRYWISKHNEEFNMRSDDVFDLVYLGEVGTGKLKATQSNAAAAYSELFSLSRQFGVRFLLSSADYISPKLMTDFIDPQIMLTGGENDIRYAEAQYLSDDQQTVIKINLGSVPKHPLIDRLGKGLAADYTGDIEMFKIKGILNQARITNLNFYENHIDEAIEEASGIVEAWVEDNVEEYRVKAYTHEVPAQPQKKVEKEEEEPEPMIEPSEDSGVLF